MHIYAFGSICRGEIDQFSDIDLLAIVDVKARSEYTDEFSVYTYEQLKGLWTLGNPFAWHLAFESKLIFSQDGSDFIKNLNFPNDYLNVEEDTQKFYELFNTAQHALTTTKQNCVFELSNVYLSIRNFATCFALGFLGVKEFSRDSSLKLGSYSLNLSSQSLLILKRARFLNSRGKGEMITNAELEVVFSELNIIKNWMQDLTKTLKE